MNQYRLVFTLLTIGGTLFLGIFFGNMVAESPLAATKYAIALAAVGVFLHVKLNREGLTQVQSCYYLGFILATILTWSPFKALAYLAPILFVLLFILALATTKNSLVLNRMLLTCLSIGIIGLFYAVFSSEFSTQNFLIASITYSSFIPLLVIPTQLINSRDLLFRCGRFYLLIALIQAGIGICQEIIGQLRGSLSAGIFMDGTIHPSLAPGVGSENAIFSLNLATSLLIALTLFMLRQKVRWIYFVGIGTALVMAQTIHLLAGLAAGVAFGGGVLLLRKRDFVLPPIIRRGAIVGACFFLLVGGIVLSKSRQIEAKFERAAMGQNPKTELIRRVAVTVPQHDPIAIYVGKGPGQFTSRATVISAGYLRALPPYFRFHTTEAFRLYAMDLWMDYMSKSVHGHSSFASPGSSWAALFGEFGSLGVLAFAAVMGILVLQLVRVPRTLATTLMGIACIAIITLLCLVGYSRFYWEIPQAIFTPLLLCKLLYANAIYDQPTSEDETPAGLPTP